MIEIRRVGLLSVQLSERLHDFTGRYLYTLSANSTDYVMSMATLENELFVARDNGKTARIERYDMETFAFKGLLNIPGLGLVTAMDSCSSCECVYIADGANDVVYRVIVRDAVYHHTSWFVEFEPVGLSTTSNNGVIVTYNEVSQADEFTASGKFVRHIQMQYDVDRPSQVFELDPESLSYVVVDKLGNERSRVCVIAGEGGETVKCIRFESGDETVHVAVNGFIYVADFLLGRVELLTSTLNHVRDVITGLSWPYKLWLTSGLLFVAEVDDSSSEDDGQTYEMIRIFQITD